MTFCRMLKKKLCGAVTASVCVMLAPVLGGCCGGSEVVPVDFPPETPDMTVKAAELSKTLSVINIRAVAISERSLEMFTGHEDELIRRIKALGFNYVCCEIKEDGLEKWRDFVIAATDGGLRCGVLFRECDFTRRGRGGNQHRFAEQGRFAESFNASLPERNRLHTAIFICEVHRFNPGNNDRPGDMLFEWKDKSYGIGGDNDMLIKYEYEQLSRVRKDLKTMSMVIGVPDFYLLESEKGNLDRNTMQNMLKLGEFNMIRVSGSKPSEVESSFASVARFAPRPAVLGVRLAEHITHEGRALRRRDWADLNRALNYAVSRNKGALKAILLGSFFSLETLWERDAVLHPMSK